MADSVDEYPPQFERKNYTFNLLRGASYPGNVVGSVRARDADQGADGYVRYALMGGQTASGGGLYFDVDPDKGALVLRRALDYQAFSAPGSDLETGLVRLTVVARSNKPDSLSDETSVSIVVEPSLLPLILQSARGSVPGWLQAVLVVLFLVIICLALGLGVHYKRKQDLKSKSRAHLMTSSGHLDSTVSGRDNKAMSGDPYLEMAAKQSSYAAASSMPPQYSEIASDHYQVWP